MRRHCRKYRFDDEEKINNSINVDKELSTWIILLDQIHCPLFHDKSTDFRNRYNKTINTHRPDAYLQDDYKFPHFQFGANVDEWLPFEFDPKFLNFKQEVLFNDYKRISHETLEQMKYEIHHRCLSYSNDQHLNEDELLAMKLFTDQDLLQKEFSKSFWKSVHSSKSLIVRRQQFYHWAQTLRRAFKYGHVLITKTLYRGLDQLLQIHSFNPFCGQPTSTTVDWNVAHQFSRGTGVIIESDPNQVVYGMDVSSVSIYDNESEIWLYDQILPLKKASIMLKIGKKKIDLIGSHLINVPHLLKGISQFMCPNDSDPMEYITNMVQDLDLLSTVTKHQNLKVFQRLFFEWQYYSVVPPPFDSFESLVGDVMLKYNHGYFYITGIPDIIVQLFIPTSFVIEYGDGGDDELQLYVYDANIRKLNNSAEHLFSVTTNVMKYHFIAIFANKHDEKRLTSKQKTLQLSQNDIEIIQQNLAEKKRYQGTDKDVNVALLGINFDSKFGVDDEEEDIAKLDFEFARSLLTISHLEKILTEPPAVVHVSTHGSHDYKSLDIEHEFQISFEETHVFRALLDEDAHYSAYYAVIALLFEMEINHFVQYGTQYALSYMWCDETRFALLTNKKIYGMFGTICDRFGMDYKYNKSGKCIEIYWGKYEDIKGEKDKAKFVHAPQAPMDVYQLKTLYQDDEDVQEILREINADYNRSLQHNVTIAKSLRKHQKFSWEILSILLHRKLMDKGAECDDRDDTQWMEEKDIKKYLNDGLIDSSLPQLDEEKETEEDDNNNNNDDDIDPDDYAAFFGSDSGDDDGDGGFGSFDDNKITEEHDDDDDNDGFVEDNSFYDDENDDDRLTKTKFGKIMDLIREVKVIPINIGRESDETMDELIERVSRFKDRLIKSIKKIPDIQIQLSQKSSSASNIHIIQFANKYALEEAKKKVDKIRSNSKYNHDYEIQFRHISKADEETKQQVGFVKRTQQKVYRIDVVNKRDPISLMLRKYLKNSDECKIKLLVLNGCNSFILGKIFSEYVKNVICIHPFVKILDSTAIIFTRHFYNSLQECTNAATSFELSVLKSYNDAKINVAQQCPSDNACGSHSHSHSHSHHNKANYNRNIKRIRRKKQQFDELHLREDWNKLQNHINDPIKFKQYRLKMQKSGASIMDEHLGDIYDDCSLILSNLSKQTMYELKEYLESSKPKIIDNKYEIEEGEYFVEKAVYKKNEHYEELSVAYFRFKSISHRREAIKLLNRKKYDEELEFSDSILFKKSVTEENIHKEWKNLGWNTRVVPRCCCSPHHPHIAQDKLILLQDGYIINRELIRNISQLKSGLRDLRRRKQERRERKDEIEEKAKLPEFPSEIPMIGADSSILSSYSGETENNLLSIKISSSTTSKMSVNKFDDDDDEKRNVEKRKFNNNTAFQNELYFKQKSSNTSLIKKTNNFNSPIAACASATKRMSGKNNFAGIDIERTHKKKNTFDFGNKDDINNKLLPQNNNGKNTFLKTTKQSENNDNGNKTRNNHFATNIKIQTPTKRINKF